jgi:hypothetical protein
VDNEKLDGSAKRQIIKTESFYVENRDVKKMHALKKGAEEFARVANKVDRSVEQRSDRRKQRVDGKTYFLFQKNEVGYNVCEIQKKDLPSWLKLGNGDIVRNKDGSGYFRGSRLALNEHLKGKL